MSHLHDLEDAELSDDIPPRVVVSSETIRVFSRYLCNCNAMTVLRTIKPSGNIRGSQPRSTHP